MHGQQDLTKLWKRSSAHGLLKLAQEIETQGSWRGYLSVAEHEIFREVLTQGGDQWARFLDGKVGAKVEILPSNNTNAGNTGGPTRPANGSSVPAHGGFDSPRRMTPATIAGPGIMESSSPRVSSAPNSIGTPQPSVTSIDPVTVCFRVRYMLYEKAIGVMFPSANASQEVDFDLLENEEDEEEEEVNAKENNKKPVVRRTDDDYDDDDYDEEEEEEEAEQGKEKAKEEEDDKQDKDTTTINEIPNKTAAESQNTLDDNDNKEKQENNDDLSLKVTVTAEDETLMTKQASGNYNKMYHIFEDDRENALKQRKLEESDRQVDMEGGGSTTTTTGSGSSGSGRGQPSAVSAAQSASFGAANLSLKHLLASIEGKRDELQLTDLELKNLISDVRKNRSKWASEDKIGQEELYEACEKVVLELRGYTEHSTAFLNKVSKRDAPNYYNIIKHPMDLNQVMRNLKSLQYKSKQEFVDDLMLIWKNCLTYNTDPKHFLRGHAYAMQKKTLQLIPLIPDITVRDRAEVEAEEQAAINTTNGSTGTGQKGTGQGGENDTDDGAASGGLMRTSRKGTGKHAGKGRKRKLEETDPEESNTSSVQDQKAQTPSEGTPAGETNSQTVPTTSETPQPNNTNNNNTNDQTLKSNSMRASPAVSIARESTPKTGGTPGAEYSTGGQVEDAPSDQEDYRGEGESWDSADVETQVWRSQFNQQRAIYCCKREDLFKENKLQVDLPATLRRQYPMTKFEEVMNYSSGESSDNTSQQQEQPTRRFFSRTSLLESIESEKKPFLLEYEVGSGVPAVPWSLDIRNTDDGMSHLQPEDIKPSNYIARGGLNDKMKSNLHEMQQIRKVCSKVSLIRQMQQQTYMHNTNTKPYNPPEIEDIDLDIESRLPNRDEYNGEVASAALKKSVGKLAMHTGFEVTEFMAIEALTEITADYIGKLGKTLRMFMEATNSEREYSLEDILLMTLHQNGIESVSSLDLYIRDDIDRHGVRLKDLGRKLTSFLSDLLRPATSDLNDGQFQDDSEQFLNGDFASQIGDEMDFFGFKELGLDKELGLLTSSVPLHLLHSRFNASLNSQSNFSQDVTRASIIQDDYPPMTRKHSQNQIGLLRPFFLAKLDSGSGEELLEGDNLPPKQRNTRAKLPPTGKISGPKKKPISKGYFLKEHEPEPEPELESKTTVKKEQGSDVLSGMGAVNENNEDNDMAMKLENEIENANREDELFGE